MIPTFTHRPPTYPVRRPEVLQAAMNHLQSGDWARLEGCPELEADLARFHGPDLKGRPAIPWFIASGTASLEAIMLGHGIGPGDEVITTPWTWGATVSSILAIGAIPVFCDVDPISARMDLKTIPAKITAKTKAVLTVHLFGHPVDCATLRSLCDQHRILFLEDCSQAHGARFQGRMVGDWGDAAAASCMGLKPLAGTEGGYALFRDPAAAEAAALYGRHPRGLKPEQIERLGGLLDALQLGWRPCSVGGALVKAALPFMAQENAARRKNAAHLCQALAGQNRVIMPEELPGAEGVYHLMSLIFDWKTIGKTREQVKAELEQAGVGTFLYIPVPIHRLPRMNPQGYTGPRVLWHEQLLRAGVDYRKISLPGAEARSLNSLEMGFNWTDENPQAMQDLAKTIRAVAGV